METREAHVEGQIHHILQEFVETGEKPNRRISFLGDHRTRISRKKMVGLWGYQCCLDEHQKDTFYGAKDGKKLGYVHAYIYMYISRHIQVCASSKFHHPGLKGLFLSSDWKLGIMSILITIIYYYYGDQ